jgi:hypothetical protein
VYDEPSAELKARQEADWIVELRAVPGNDGCADCIGAHMPTWASGNLGVLLCTHCVGAHRNLGTHISQPLSLHLDDWTEDLRDNMFAQGNAKSNAHYEANHVYAKYKPSFDGDIEHTVAYVTSKYEKRSFTPDGNGEMEAWESTGQNMEIVDAQVHAGVLIVKVLQARDLPSAHYHLSHSGASAEQRYCKVKLDGTKMKTHIVKGTSDATWDENLQLNINHSDAPIRLEINDHTALSNKEIGACTFTCQNLPAEEATNMTLALDQGGEVDLELLWWPLDS